MSNISGMAYLLLNWLYKTPNSIVIRYHKLETNFIGFREGNTFDGPRLSNAYSIDPILIKELVERDLIDVGFSSCSYADDDDYSAFQINRSGILYLKEVQDGLV